MQTERLRDLAGIAAVGFALLSLIGLAGVLVTSPASPAHATILTFGDAAQSPDVRWTLAALAPQAGRVSDRWLVPEGGWYQVLCAWWLERPATPGDTLELFLLAEREAVEGDRAMPRGVRGTLLGLATAVAPPATRAFTFVTEVRLVVGQVLALALWNTTAAPLANNTGPQGCVVRSMSGEPG